MSHTATTTIALNNLTASAGNVRTSEGRNIESLAQSILSLGLLQNLVVVACEGTDQEGKYEVAAGGRRFQALTLLASRGLIAADYPVPCTERERADLTAVSLTENVQREAMNPAEESEAFVKLTNEGLTVDAIADAFGVTPLVVERRLALTNASPKLFAMLRAGEMNSEQLRALCATDDHARQEQAWDSARWQGREPATLRRLAVGEAIEAGTDKRVKFIGGVEAFEAAGGHVRRDLFSDALSSGFIDDAALLEKLVGEKLEAYAQIERDAGWGWVEIMPSFDWSIYHRYGRLQAPAPQLTKEQKAKLAELDKEAQALRAELSELSDLDETDDAQDERADEIQARMKEIGYAAKAIREDGKGFSDEAKAAAGVIVALDGGSLRIERGMVKADDRKAAQAAGGSVSGGRETNSAGRKPNAISDALHRSLQCHRNIAVQAETAKNAHVAKVLLACWTVGKIRGSYGDHCPTDLAIGNRYGTRQAVGSMGQDVQERAAAFDAMGAALVKGLPAKKEELWDALVGYTGEQLDTLIAYGVACSVSLEDGHKGLTGKLIGSLDFDMAAHFDATAANYLGRNLKKDQIVKALSEAGKADDKAALLVMKTKALATEAEARLKGTGWVPAEIRTPTSKPVPAKAKAPAKPAAKAAKKGASKAAKAPGKASTKGKAKTAKAG